MNSSCRSSTEKLIPDGESPSSSEHDLDVSRWEPEVRKTKLTTWRRRIVAISCIAFSLGLNVVLGALLYNSLLSNRKPRWDEFTLPSPAETAISHTLVKFDNSINSDKTKYQGRPNEENTRLWEDLFSHGISRISYEEAVRLTNKTMPEAPYEGSGYLILLNVFHNLHCLNSIRKAIYYFQDPKWTADDNPYTQMRDGDIDSMLRDIGADVSIHHVDHCIDILRQHEMCASDITPNVFQYSPKDFEVRAFANVLHECRDFEKIKQWAEDHRAPPFKGFGDGEAVGKCGLNDSGDCL